MMAQEANEWMTSDAQAYLERWRLRQDSAWRAEGADPEEVWEDLGLHLRAKAESLRRPLEASDLESALGKMGLPLTPEPPASFERSPAPVSSPPKRFFLWRWMGILNRPFFLGFFPLLVVLLEAITGMFGHLVYDPISRWPQLLLLLTVSGIGWAGQYPGRWSPRGKWLPFLCAAGLIPALYWSLPSLIVITGAAFIYAHGILLTYGIGLLFFPVVLACMIIAAAPILTGFGLLKVSRPAIKSAPWLGGLGLGLVLLLVVEGPAYVTRYGLATNQPGLVRNWGSPRLMHEIARQPTWGMATEDTSGFLTSLGRWNWFQSGQIRQVDDVLDRRRFYYRVTGESPNLEPESSYLSSQQNRWSGRFDQHVGGDVVGPLVDDLEMSGSRLDGHLDGASGLGYWEWTMEFRNKGHDQKEARLQLLLPPGGVVSRLTLWVDGEPQEAAFGAKSQVTAAYKAVVSKRRDPVLVRWVGADRVLVQCFPVPPEGKMKIRLGVTAPLDERDRLFLPKIMERNHLFADSLQNAIWVQGDLEMSMKDLKGASREGRWRETHGMLPLETLSERHSFVQCHDRKPPTVVWTKDPFAEARNAILIREQLPDRAEKKARIVFVVDGSKHFAPWYDSFRSALKTLQSRGVKAEVIYAAEDTVWEDESTPDFVGGQDNLPALVRGMERAIELQADELIWLHGPQPVALENPERLAQLIERGFRKVNISTVDLTGAPNRLLEQLRTTISLASTGRPAGPGDLEETMVQMIARSHRQYRDRRLPLGAAPEGTEVWDHLARWQVWQEVQQAAAEGRVPEPLAQKAATYQLVTPVSGAVVLETQEQFKRFGLDQVDESSTPSIPGIPEPSTSLLLILAGSLVWRRRRDLLVV